MNTISRRYNMNVCDARLEDYPTIAAMRIAFFQKIGKEYCQEHPDTRWVVAWIGYEVAGVCGYMDIGNECWVTDLYRVNGAVGLAAFRWLRAWFEDHAERIEADVVFGAYLENMAVHNAIIKDRARSLARGVPGYEPESVIYRKRRHGRIVEAGLPTEGF